MHNLENFFPENLYHSYIILGDPDTLSNNLLEFFIKRGDTENNSQDLLNQSYDSFSISDISLIKDWSSSKSTSQSKKICILSTKFINREAEQALLKILEEPKDNTHFFILIPPSVKLLDTILSRCHVVDLSVDLLKNNISDFCKLKLQERLDYVASLIKDHEDDKNSGLLRYNAINFVNNLEQYFRENLILDKSVYDKVKIDFIFSEIRKAREYLSLPGCSTKMILEHLSLVI